MKSITDLLKSGKQKPNSAFTRENLIRDASERVTGGLADKQVPVRCHSNAIMLAIRGTEVGPGTSVEACELSRGPLSGGGGVGAGLKLHELGDGAAKAGITTKQRVPADGFENLRISDKSPQNWPQTSKERRCLWTGAVSEVGSGREICGQR